MEISCGAVKDNFPFLPCLEVRNPLVEVLFDNSVICGHAIHMAIYENFAIKFLSRYGAILENLQSRADIIERIRGCIVDSAPVLEIRPEVWTLSFCCITYT